MLKITSQYVNNYDNVEKVREMIMNLSVTDGFHSFFIKTFTNELDIYCNSQCLD